MRSTKSKDFKKPFQEILERICPWTGKKFYTDRPHTIFVDKKAQKAYWAAKNRAAKREKGLGERKTKLEQEQLQRQACPKKNGVIFMLDGVNTTFKNTMEALKLKGPNPKVIANLQKKKAKNQQTKLKF